MHPRIQMTATRAHYEIRAHGTPVTEDGTTAVAVVLLGAIIAGSALLTLLGAIASPSYSAAGGKTLFTLLGIGDVLLGVGIMLRLNLARQVYVVLTTIGVVLGLIAVVVALASGATLTSAAERGVTTVSSQATAATSVRTQIADVEQSQALTPQEKEARVSQLRAAATQSAPTSIAGGLSSSGVTEFALSSFALSIVALFFFTRIRVKRVFA